MAKTSYNKTEREHLRKTLVLAKNTMETLFPSIQGREAALRASYEPTSAEHWGQLAITVQTSIASINAALGGIPGHNAKNA